MSDKDTLECEVTTDEVTVESPTEDQEKEGEATSEVLGLSISEAAELTAGGWHAPKYIQPLEVLFRMKDPTTGKYINEATGWAMDASFRGPLNQIGAYIGSAVLQMAAASAGCKNPHDCQVYGIKPSSLLTLTSAVVGMFAAILMPVFGAIVDHTRHRKLIACISGFIAVLTTGLQIGISAQSLNWLYILILDAIQSFSLLVHTTAVFAYLPEITLVQSALPAYSSHFNIRQFISQFTVASFVIIAGIVYAKKGLAPIDASALTARVGAALAFSYGCVFFVYSWSFLFRQRPALSHVPKGSNVLTAGFKQVYTTSRKILKDYQALRWFIFSLLWSPEAGSGVVLSIAVTFMVTVVKLTTLEVAEVGLIVMLGNIFGSFVSKWVCSKINPLNSYRIAMTSLGVIIAITAAYVDGPSKKASCFGFASGWGTFMGWAYPSQRVLFVTLIPKGQETEMMGVFFFAGQIIGWLPVLLFTIINEHGVNMRWGFAIISFFCVFSIACTLPMGSYKHATTQVARDSEAKFKSVLKAASEHDNYSGGFSLGKSKKNEAPHYGATTSITSGANSNATAIRVEQPLSTVQEQAEEIAV